jgi:hypothetical protein
MENILTALGIKKFSIVIAGAVGGLISLRHYVELTLQGKVVVIVSSMCLANYATHPVALYFGPSADEFELGIAAAIGLFGLSIVSSATTILKDTALWKGLLNRLLGGER